MTDLVRLYSTFCVIVRALHVFRNSSASEELDLTKSDVSGVFRSRYAVDSQWKSSG